MNTEENKENQDQTTENIPDPQEQLPENQDAPSEQSELQKVLSSQAAHTTDTYTYIGPGKTQEPKSKNEKLRLGLEIAGGLLLLILFFSSLGRVSKKDYEDERSKYVTLKEDYSEQTSELERITASYKKAKSEYDDYKAKMSKFEGLTAEESDALLEKIDEIAAEKKAKDEAAAAEKKAKEEEAKKAAEEEAAKAEAERQAKASATMSQKNALSKAQDYLRFTAFSYTGLIGQLEYEGFSHEDAVYGADQCGADWNEQAAKKAQDYLDFTSFSRDGLIGQLEYEGFTREQAEYGVSAVGY